MNKYIVSIDNINPVLKTISILIEYVTVNEEDVIIDKISRERCGFVPGDLDVIASYLVDKIPGYNTPVLLNELASLWTQNVIDNYNEYVAGLNI